MWQFLRSTEARSAANGSRLRQYAVDLTPSFGRLPQTIQLFRAWFSHQALVLRIDGAVKVARQATGSFDLVGFASGTESALSGSWPQIRWVWERDPRSYHTHIKYQFPFCEN